MGVCSKRIEEHRVNQHEPNSRETRICETNPSFRESRKFTLEIGASLGESVSVASSLVNAVGVR